MKFYGALIGFYVVGWIVTIIQLAITLSGGRQTRSGVEFVGLVLLIGLALYGLNALHSDWNRGEK